MWSWLPAHEVRAELFNLKQDPEIKLTLAFYGLNFDSKDMLSLKILFLVQRNEMKKNLIIRPSLFVLILQVLLVSNAGTVFGQPKLIIPTGSDLGVNTIEFNPDGKLFVTSSDDKTAKIWETSSGRVLNSFEGHSSDVNSACFSPDGKLILTSSSDKTARIWESITGNLLGTLEGHFIRACFSPDGKTILTNGEDHNAALWETSSGKLITVLSPVSKYFGLARFSPDGKVVGATCDGIIRIWEPFSGKLIMQIYDNKENDQIEFSPDNRYFTSSGQLNLSSPNNNVLKLWDRSSGQLVKSFNGHTYSIWYVRFNQDCNKIISGSADGTVKIWDIESGSLIRSITVYNDRSKYFVINSVEISHDGKLIAIIIGSEYNLNKLKIYNVNSGRLVRSFRISTGKILFSPDDKLLIGETGIWEVCTGKMLHSLKGCTKDVSTQFSPDGRLIYTISGHFDSEESVKLWSAEDGKYIGQIIHKFPDRLKRVSETRDLYAKFSSDGKRILTHCFLSPSDMGFSRKYKLAKVWDASTRKLLFSINGYPYNIIDEEFSPNGKFVAISDVSGCIDIWNISAGKIEERRK
jgi:WD40 repeat protein